MGTKNPDVVVAPPSAMTALTLAEMHVRGWEVKAACSRCGIKLRISLPAMIRTHGPDAVWWGRKARCPGLECQDGTLTYAARALRGGSWVSLTPAPGELALAARQKRQRVYPGPR